ncbi:MAG: HAD family hydrolase [Dehalococcoidia bacterium]|nr:HAD family hydrolase [Dehalococcoidia bacterium]
MTAMIKAVFFDFFNTLAYFDPPREETYAGIAADLGIKVTPAMITAALPEADTYWRSENYKKPVRQREQDDKVAVYREYGLRILAGTGATPDQALQMLATAFSRGWVFKSFPDSVPALKLVKQRKLITGLISNVGQEIDSYCREMGFEPYLDYKVTSFEVGFDKPRPEIFQLALDRAGVGADESVFIGDVYEQDIVGARGVGMKPILINRNGNTSYDCIVISDLSGVLDYV